MHHARQHIVVPLRITASSQIALFAAPSTSGQQMTLQVMPDDHSELVPPLPIPNRTVKRLCADDSVHAHVKVGYRQACYKKSSCSNAGASFFSAYRVCLEERS